MKKNTKKTTTVKPTPKKGAKTAKKDKKLETGYQYVKPILKTGSVNNATELDWSELIFSIPTQERTKIQKKKSASVLSPILARLTPVILFSGMLFQISVIEESILHAMFYVVTMTLATVAWYKFMDKYDRYKEKSEHYRNEYIQCMKDNIDLCEINKKLIKMNGELIDFAKIRMGGH